MKNVNKDLFQFSTYEPSIDLTFHQYLLMTDESILFHSGNIQQASKLIPKLKEQLNDKQLKYVFISHFEADECGGLSLVLENFPEAEVICSQVTSNQLKGFGFDFPTIIKKPKDKLDSSSYNLEFINYPSEIHLWDGLLVLENERGIFFSSDLMISFGKSIDIADSTWESLVDNIEPYKVPDAEKLEQLKEDLKLLSPKFVAVGHGSCLRING